MSQERHPKRPPNPWLKLALLGSAYLAATALIVVCLNAMVY